MPKSTSTPEHDAVVVGGGPAGLSAATWLARYRRGVVLVDAGEGRNRWTDEVHGYLGSDAVPPSELGARARADLARYSTVRLLDGRATAARREPGGGFVVTTDVGGAEPETTDATTPGPTTMESGELTARRLVLATGVSDVFPDVGGFFEHYGTSVFHCPTCDGYEARDCDVVVFGWSPEVAGFAVELLNWARRVTVVTDGRRFEGGEARMAALAARGVAVVEDEAVGLVGRRGDLRAVRLHHAESLPCNLAFFTIAHRPHTELAEQLGCRLTEEGCLEVDEHGQSSVAGVYGAGDVTPGLQLVQVATAKGATAGVACARSLSPEPDEPPRLSGSRGGAG